MVPLAATRLEFYVTTMIAVIYGSYDSLVDNLNYIKSLKIKDNPGGNIIDCSGAILVDAKYLDSDITFKPNNLGYIVCIFYYTYDSIFHL